MDILGAIPSIGGLAFTIAVFIIALSVIVFVHEYGHYIVGRWCGIDAEVFSIGFGPVLLSRVDRRGTRWQVAALPFGGFVKFLGDADASSGRDAESLAAMDAERKRRTMHGAPLWARSATVAAGPLFNFAMSILVFAAFFAIRGVAIEEPVIAELKPLPAPVQELEPGDRIRAVDGRSVDSLVELREAAEEIEPAPTATYEVERDGARIEARGPFPFPPVADGVQPRSAAHSAGLQPGDVIVSIDGVEIHAFEELRTHVEAAEGAPLALGVWRDGDILDISLAPRSTDVPTGDGGFEQRWLIGLSGGSFFESQTRRAGPVEAVAMGVAQTGMIIEMSLSGLWNMIIGTISTCNLQGPVGIAEVSGATAQQGLASFIWFIAVLSTAIGLVNLFPIPVLDGGHLVFHAYEAVAGRPPSERVLNALMMTGLVLLVSLMVFAVTNDLFCP